MLAAACVPEVRRPDTGRDPEEAMGETEEAAARARESQLGTG